MNFKSVLVAALFGLTGCSFLPAVAPTVEQVEQSTRPEDTGFLTVGVDDRVVDVLAHAPDQAFSAGFRARGPAADLRIGKGDVLQISIMEIGSTGLFGGVGGVAGAAIPSSVHSTPLQPRVVERDGAITVPFAGRIQAEHATADMVRARIEAALAKTSVSPQVMVQLVSSNANNVTVGGEVNKAGVVPLTLHGDRLLDVLAASGGAKYPAYESKVRLTRSGRGSSVLLQHVVDHPQDNVFVQPGDDVYVSHEPQTFTAFGATFRAGQYSFDNAHLTLAEAIAKSGGMVDNQTDASGVFLFRFEPRSTAERLSPGVVFPIPMVPVVYRINLLRGQGYVWAGSIEMHDKDIILVSEASGAQFLKFLVLVRGVTGVFSDISKSAVTTTTPGAAAAATSPVQ
jgi:polysaccharide export outer membrane protein